MDGKTLRGSRQGKSPQVKLVEVLALHLGTTLAQARAEGRENKALQDLWSTLGPGVEGEGGGGGCRVPVPRGGPGDTGKRGDYLFLLKGNQGGAFGRGGRGLPGGGGEEAFRRDRSHVVGGVAREAWTYRVLASPYLPEGE
ncbi:MAG: hypothetical protein ABDH20_11760 [Thermus sp.]